MVAERFRSRTEEGSDVGNLGGRGWIFGAARAFEDVAALNSFSAEIARFAGDAEQKFRASVMRLQVVVSDSPILNGVILGQFGGTILFRSAREQFETVRNKTGKPPGPMLTGATRTGAGKKRTVLAERKSTLLRRMTERHRLLRKILHHAHADGVVELVHAGRIIFRLALTAALEHDDRA